MAGSFAAAAWFLSGRIPDAARTAASLAAVGAASLAWPTRLEPVMPLAAAVAAAVLWQVLCAQSLPPLLALVVATAPCLASTLLTTARPHFAPPHLRDEGLLLVLVFAVVVAMVPAFSEGWHAALSLNADSAASQPAQVPLWTAATAASVVALGASYSAWRYR
ncbi:MAG: hypothetical protein ABMA15_16160 [Vicinamibacterales bacterium]